MGGGRVHGGAAIWTERISNLADIPVFGKKYRSVFLRVPPGAACRRSPCLLMAERGPITAIRSSVR